MIYSLSSWLVLVALGLALGCLWRFWHPLGFLFAALGPLGDPIGSLEGPLGPLGPPLGVPPGSLWVPLGCLGCTGRFSQICRKLDAQFRANVSILQCLRIKNSLAEFIPGSRGSRLSAQSGARAAVPNPTSRAGGQDDVSFTNSLKLYALG